MIERFLHEIHRRSIWQVFAIFMATSWIVLQVLDVLINHGVVPGWVFRAGLVLLLIGLPVVLATAFVQAGVTPAAAPDGDGEAAGGGTVHADTTKAGRARTSVLTWRNAIMGGVGAFALLGLASAGYMGMRTMGIGAPGTLMAQGVIEEDAEVVLADFESPTDSELGDVVTNTLRIDLLQSDAFRVLEPTELSEPMERMQADPSTRLTPELAMQMAEREGYAAVITGSVASAGTGYVLTASIHGGDGFRRLAGFRETARNDGELVDAIERLSRSMRDKVGESLRTVRGGPSLAQVTTASLPALRAYTRGDRLDAAGEYTAAIEQFERAVSLDSTFALAHRKVAVSLINMNIRPAAVRAAARSAFELRDRLPELESHLVTAFYHEHISGDVDAAARAYEEVLAIDSANGSAGNGLGNQYIHMGRYDDAARTFERALRADNASAMWFNLTRAHFNAGDTARARLTLDSAAVAMPDWSELTGLRTLMAAATGRYGAADSLASVYTARASTPYDRTLARTLDYQLLALRGQVDAAERVLTAAGAEVYLADDATMALLHAELVLLRNDADAVVRLIDEAVSGASPENVEFASAIDILLEAEQVERAAELFDAWADIVPPDERGTGSRVNTELIAARIAGMRGDHEAALDGLRALRRRCPGCTPSIEGAMGQIHDAAGDTDRAIAAYEASLERPDLGALFRFVALPRTLRRLGELHDARGDTRTAIEYYSRFTDLWRDADPELQPHVRAVNARIAQLLADR